MEKISNLVTQFIAQKILLGVHVLSVWRFKMEFINHNPPTEMKIGKIIFAKESE